MPPRIGQSDRSHEGLNGDVRSVRVETATVEERAVEVSVEGRRVPVEAKSFDAHGRCLTWTIFDEAGAVSRSYVFAYDGAGRRVSSTVTGEDGVVLETSSYEYDASGTLVADVITDARRPGVRYAHEHRTDGESAVTVRRRADGNPGRREEIVRDAHGREVEMRVFALDGKLDHKWLYGYDRAGRRTSEISLFADGSFRSKEICKYGDRGEEYKVAVYRPDGSLSAKWAYTYAYDRAGNWTRRTTYLKAGALARGRYLPVAVSHRAIEYG